MRTPPLLLALACLAWPLSAPLALEAQVARINSPGNRALASGPVDITIEVRNPLPGTWELLDLREGAAPLQLAAGSGEVIHGQPVFSGFLAPGAHRLVLELQSAQPLVSDEHRLVVCAPSLPGWPYEENLAAIPYDQELMAETCGSEVLLTRPAEGGRQNVGVGQLVWLDGEGQALPGWPVDLSELQHSISPHSAPLRVRRNGDEHVLLVSKTGLLELDRAGNLVAQAPVSGLVLGEPVCYAVPGEGLHTFLWVQQQEQLRLCRYNALLELVESHPLGGSPAWPRVVLGDLNGDGRLDLILPLRQNGQLRIEWLDLQDGVVSLLHQLADPGLTGIQAGDLEEDGRADLVLAGRQGLVMALDSDGPSWTRNFALSSLGALNLVDSDGDGRQEVLLLARDTEGVRLLQLDSQGVDGAASGTLVSAQGEADIAPLLVRGGAAGPRFLVTVQPREPGSWETRFLWVGPTGEVEEPDWLLPTMTSGPPRLVDLNGDGDVELLAGDAFGRWVAWPTGCRESRPPHPLGDSRHGGLTLQPVPAGCQPGCLGGAVALPETYLLPCGTEVGDLELVKGHLLVNSAWHPGNLTVGSRAQLSLLPGAAWSGDARVPLCLEGRLDVLGDGTDMQSEIRTESPTNLLLQGLDLQMVSGSRLRLENCLLHELEQSLQVGSACTLEVVNSWLLAGSRGIQVEGGLLDVRSSMLQPGDVGLVLSNGAQAWFRSSVITATDVDVALDCVSSTLEMRDCAVLTCQDALRVSGPSWALLDSIHFQGNQRDVIVADDPASLTLRNCDFIETHLLGVDHNGSLPLTATGCHWDLQTACEGPVVRVDDKLDPVKPLVIPQPVFRVDTGPMVDGDDPLEWVPVELSVGGIPIRVEYRIYRSEHPYGLVSPENLVAVTSLTRWRDPHPLPATFYCVTASMGKPTLE